MLFLRKAASSGGLATHISDSSYCPWNFSTNPLCDVLFNAHCLFWGMVKASYVNYWPTNSWGFGLEKEQHPDTSSVAVFRSTTETHITVSVSIKYINQIKLTNSTQSSLFKWHISALWDDFVKYPPETLSKCSIFYEWCDLCATQTQFGSVCIPCASSTRGKHSEKQLRWQQRTMVLKLMVIIQINSRLIHHENNNVS